MGYMNEFPHSRMFDSDLREILEMYNTVKGLPRDWETFRNSMSKDWNELKIFVDTYFENLNVQNEINKKIDSLVADGTMDRIIRPIFNEYNNELLVLKTRMDTFTALPEGATTGDAELADGKVDYKGKEHVNIGAHIRSVTSQLSGEIDYLKNIGDGQSVVISTIDEFVDNHYLDSNGKLYDGGNIWLMSNYKSCKDFNAIGFDIIGYNTNDLKLCSIAFYDKNKNFISGIWNKTLYGEGRFKGQCIIPNGAIFFKALMNLDEKYRTLFSPYVILYKNSVSVDMTDIAAANDEVYARGGKTERYGNWYTSNWVQVEGFDSVTYKDVSGYHSGATQLENITFFNGELARIDGVFANVSDNNPRVVQGCYPIPNNAVFMKVLYNSNNAIPTIVLNKKQKTKNIICIGDSITEGYDNTDILENNYPKYLQDNLGLDYTVFNAGVGGSQAITWWNEWKEFLNITEENADVFLIMLGGNGGFSNTFETDVDTYDEYNDYAETVTGCTCKLVEWLMEQAPKAQIVMVTPTFADDGKVPTNAKEMDKQCEYMGKFTERYHFPVIDLRNLEGVNKHNCYYWLSSDGLHHTEKSYERIGNIIANQLKAII